MVYIYDRKRRRSNDTFKGAYYVCFSLLSLFPIQKQHFQSKITNTKPSQKRLAIFYTQPSFTGSEMRIKGIFDTCYNFSSEPPEVSSVDLGALTESSFYLLSSPLVLFPSYKHFSPLSAFFSSKKPVIKLRHFNSREKY